jgi:carbonic anhydrase
MSVIDELIENNKRHVERFDRAGIPTAPTRHLAIVACMDARMNLYGILGLDVGDAHIIRNAGGVVTDDTIRSLIISQRLLGTRAIALVHHTDCGMLKFRDDDMRAEIQAETGIRPHFPLEAFRDLDADLKQSMARIRASPFIPHKDEVRGFVYDVQTGRLREVR